MVIRECGKSNMVQVRDERFSFFLICGEFPECHIRVNPKFSTKLKKQDEREKI